MSIATITAAQRVEVRDSALSAALAMQRFTQSATTPRADEVAEASPILNAAAAALVVAGANGLPATSVVVANGGPVTITDSNGGPSVAGTAQVAAGALSSVSITAATNAIVQNGDVVAIKNFNATSAGASCTLEVGGGAETGALLAAAAAIVTNTSKRAVGTVTGSGTFGTFTVVNGVITGIVLSAS